MAILVTGGAGYIGSHTCVDLLEAGEEIVLLDNFSNAARDVPDRIKTLTGKDFPVYETDILHVGDLRTVFDEQPIESVIHFAGLKAVGESVAQPARYYRNNVTGTLNLCAAMADAGCKRIVFSSSATVYGLSPDVPFREDAPLSAINPYGMSKLVIERILTDIAAADERWSIALLRYFNPIGAHESGMLGEVPRGIPNNLLPYIAQVASGQLATLNVFGNDYDTKDGTGVRDYLHVRCLSEGHLKALAYIREHTGAEAINLGTGTGYSVLEIISAFEQASGVPIPYVFAPRRPGDAPVCFADPSKAHALLGWKATRSLFEMCRDAWNFAKRPTGGAL